MRKINFTELLFHHDNASRPHGSRGTMETIDSQGFQVIPHPPYSPDLHRVIYFYF